jgi:broad specificity phosphatase PhoE
VKRLVLVRHGESIWNAEGRVQGQSCAGLSELGHAQARAVAVALAATYPVASVVTSDLQRTVETTAPLAEALGVEPTLDATVRERSFGSWERRLRREVVADDPDRWQRWLDGEEVIAEVGGESATQLTDRVVPRLRELLASTPDGGVTIVVTHGGPIWHGTHVLLDVPRGTFAGIDNASVTAFLGFDDRVVLDRWNEVAHLPPSERSGWRPASDTSVRSEAGGTQVRGASTDGPAG